MTELDEATKVPSPFQRLSLTATYNGSLQRLSFSLTALFNGSLAGAVLPPHRHGRDHVADAKGAGAGGGRGGQGAGGRYQPCICYTTKDQSQGAAPPPAKRERVRHPLACANWPRHTDYPRRPSLTALSNGSLQAAAKGARRQTAVGCLSEGCTQIHR